MRRSLSPRASFESEITSRCRKVIFLRGVEAGDSSSYFYFSFEACQTQAVLSVGSYSDKSFRASSFLATNEPYKARLRNTIGAWLPNDNNNADDYLEIELGDVFFICAVATQGHPYREEWTKSYKMRLFLKNWITFKENNVEKV